MAEAQVRKPWPQLTAEEKAERLRRLEGRLRAYDGRVRTRINDYALHSMAQTVRHAKQERRREA